MEWYYDIIVSPYILAKLNFTAQYPSRYLPE